MEIRFIIPAKEGVVLEMTTIEARALQKPLGKLNNPLREQMGITHEESLILNEIHTLLYKQYGLLE